MLPPPPSDDSGFPDLSGLDADATLTLAEEVLLRRRRAEVDDLRLVAHWAALNSTDPRRTTDGRRAWSEDRLVEVGGEGSPRVREFCIAEIAMVRQVHPLTGQAAIADVLDLQHRLPSGLGASWRRSAGRRRGWREVASMTRSVPARSARRPGGVGRHRHRSTSRVLAAHRPSIEATSRHPRRQAEASATVARP